MNCASEAELWQAHLAVLRSAMRMRKPDVLARVRSETARLEREVEALNGRRMLAMRTDGNAAPGLAAQLADSIAERLRRVSDLAALILAFGARPADDDVGASAEAAARPASTDPIEMLYGKGKLDADHMRAAREIAWVHEAITRAGRARVSRLSEVKPTKGWRDMPVSERAALVHAKRFMPWAERLRAQAPATLDIVLRVAVLGTAIYPVARKHKIGWATCVAKLADGLEQYWRRSDDGDRH